mmetsp:Transcript_8336/g.11609  ORF Transcript_8336/g.11609 Transcript_8336/m.11609 type:complete len:257 (-) Transcript_8336:81-851(-)
MTINFIKLPQNFNTYKNYYLNSNNKIIKCFYFHNGYVCLISWNICAHILVLRHVVLTEVPISVIDNNWLIILTVQILRLIFFSFRLEQVVLVLILLVLTPSYCMIVILILKLIGKRLIVVTALVKPKKFRFIVLLLKILLINPSLIWLSVKQLLIITSIIILMILSNHLKIPILPLLMILFLLLSSNKQSVSLHNSLCLRRPTHVHAKKKKMLFHQRLLHHKRNIIQKSVLLLKRVVMMMLLVLLHWLFFLLLRKY